MGSLQVIVDPELVAKVVHVFVTEDNKIIKDFLLDRLHHPLDISNRVG